MLLLFRTSLLEEGPKVSEIALTDFSGELDCDELELEWNTTDAWPTSWECLTYNRDSSGVRIGGAFSLLVYGLGTMFTLVMISKFHVS